MTIENENVRQQHPVVNGQADYGFNFKILKQTDLKVVLSTSAGVDTVQTLTTHYTVSGVGSQNGGTVTFTTGNIPATSSSATVTLVLDTELKQTMDLSYAVAIDSEALEGSLDTNLNINKRTRDLVDRSIHISDGDSSAPSLTVPSLASRASKALAFDSAGNVTVTDLLSGSITVTDINANGDLVTFGGDITTTGNITGNVTGNISGGSVSGNGSGLTGTASSFTAGNVTTNAALTGDVETTSGNATRIASGVIVNDDINASAGISYSKMAAPGTAPIWNQSTTGQAATVVTNANMTGDVTSSGSNATTIANGAVDGLKLDTATTPTDGYVLTATDALGGMDWELSTVGDISRVNGGTGISTPDPEGPIVTLNIDAAQPTITSLGTLSGLTVTNPIAGSVTGSAATAGSITGVTTSNIVQLTDTQTLTNKTLTSPDINTPDIDGGTIDGAVIGNTSANVGKFCSSSASTPSLVLGNLLGAGQDFSGLFLNRTQSYVSFGTTYGQEGIRYASNKVEIKNTTGDTFGQPYHAGMVSGEGAYFENLTAATIPTSTNTSSAVAHTLSSLPRIVQVSLRYVGTGELGYSANDEIPLTTSASNNAVLRGISYVLDATNVTILISSSFEGLIANKSTGAAGNAITRADWRIAIRAWK